MDDLKYTNYIYWDTHVYAKSYAIEYYERYKPYTQQKTSIKNDKNRKEHSLDLRTLNLKSHTTYKFIIYSIGVNSLGQNMKEMIKEELFLTREIKK